MREDRHCGSWTVARSVGHSDRSLGGHEPGCDDLRDVGRVTQHRARLAIGILGRAGLKLLLNDVVEEVRVLKIGDVVEER